MLQKRRKRRMLGKTTQWVNRAQHPNHVWSYDFVFDQTDEATQLKCLTVVDEFTRQGMTVEVARNMTGADVVTVLERVRQGREAVHTEQAVREQLGLDG